MDCLKDLSRINIQDLYIVTNPRHLGGGPGWSASNLNPASSNHAYIAQVAVTSGCDDIGVKDTHLPRYLAALDLCGRYGRGDRNDTSALCGC